MAILSNKARLIPVLMAAAAIGSGTLSASCNKKENTAGAAQKIPFTGNYKWTFEIPGVVKQESTHIFFVDSIQYKMNGPAYTTAYTQQLITYNVAEAKCISIGKGKNVAKDGVYFVMFFKDVTDSTVTVYKHECTRGLEEAETFARPEDNTTADHGWNVYIKQ